MTRLLLLAAALLACLTWSCSAEATTETQESDMDAIPIVTNGRHKIKKTKLWIRHPVVFFASDIPETLLLAETSRRKLILAKSAGNLAKSTDDPESKAPVNATAELLKSRTRADNAAKALEQTANDASQLLKMAAAVAKELYDNETGVELLTEEHMKWFDARYANATAQDTAMTESIKVLQRTDKQHLGIHPIIVAVLTPARNIYKLAQNAENDAKHVVYKRVFTQMLAERIESLHGLAKTETATAASCEINKEKNAVSSTDNTETVTNYRDAAARAYLSAASAQKVAASCVTRINGNATQVEVIYYALRDLLAKIQSTDYNAMRVYQSIADEAHANAEEYKEIAAGTPSHAEDFTKIAKAHLDGITSCVNVTEAKWRANEAQKASRKALNEMHYALHQLFSVTVSLQQVADAKKAVDGSEALKNALANEKQYNEIPKTATPSKAGEPSAGQNPPMDGTGKTGKVSKEKTEEGKEQERAEDAAAMREAKKKAVESEKEAETSYAAVKVHADKAADAVLHVENIVRQTKDLAAQVPENKKADLQEQLSKAETALQTANTSSHVAYAAAETVFGKYNKTKNAADSALQGFERNIVARLQTTAAESAEDTKKTKTAEEEKAKKALEDVEKQKAEALTAYNEMIKLVEALGKQNGFDTLKAKSYNTGDRDSATVPSSLRISVAVLCVMAVSMLGAV